MKGDALDIILVEDNPDHAEMIMRGFEFNKIANKIVHLKDGAEAIDFFERQGEYALIKDKMAAAMILLDLRLPKIDGLEVLKHLKSHKHLKKIPVVILTSSDAETDVAKAYEFFANSYLVKPVDFYKFNKLISDLGFYWLCWNSHPYMVK